MSRKATTTLFSIANSPSTVPSAAKTWVMMFGWGALHPTALKEAVKTAVINKRAGGMGLISGRKAFQRPLKDGVGLLHAIQDVYLNKAITIA